MPSEKSAVNAAYIEARMKLDDLMPWAEAAQAECK